jgi:hypothetical protein
VLLLKACHKVLHRQGRTTRGRRLYAETQAARCLLEQYAEHGTAQFIIPDVLKVPPISEHGIPMEIGNLLAGQKG